MTHHRSGYSWRFRALFGLIAVVACVIVASCGDESTTVTNSPGTSVLASPPGIPGGMKKVYSFNLIGYPEGREYAGGCGEGNRIFVNRDAHHAHILVTDNDNGWNVVDCNATSDNWGELETDEAGTYLLYVRILGKMGGNLKICADTYEDHLTGEHLCLLGSIDMTRGKQSRFSVMPTSMYDAELEDIVWSVDTNKDFRIAQFRVYKVE